jgi:hypothetical protein
VPRRDLLSRALAKSNETKLTKDIFLPKRMQSVVEHWGIPHWSLPAMKKE